WFAFPLHWKLGKVLLKFLTMVKGCLFALLERCGWSLRHLLSESSAGVRSSRGATWEKKESDGSLHRALPMNWRWFRDQPARTRKSTRSSIGDNSTLRRNILIR